MNKDIRLAVSFVDHPKKVKLERRLGPLAVLSWIYLLCHVGESRPGGDLFGMDPEDVAIAAKWGGDPVEFLQVLEDVRLLDRTEGGLVVHDWATHNPFAAGAEERSAKAKKAADARWGKEPKAAPSNPSPDTGAMHTDAPSMRAASPSNAPTPSPTPYPDSPTTPPPTATPSPAPVCEGTPAAPAVRGAPAGGLVIYAERSGATAVAVAPRPTAELLSLQASVCELVADAELGDWVMGWAHRRARTQKRPDRAEIQLLEGVREAFAAWPSHPAWVVEALRQARANDEDGTAIADLGRYAGGIVRTRVDRGEVEPKGRARVAARAAAPGGADHPPGLSAEELQEREFLVSISHDEQTLERMARQARRRQAAGEPLTHSTAMALRIVERRAAQFSEASP